MNSRSSQSKVCFRLSLDDLLKISTMLCSHLDWTGKETDENDISVWEDNWEDDNVEDDFNKQLR